MPPHTHSPSPLSESSAETTALAVFDEFFAARRSTKPSPHTLAAYRRDLTAILRIAARRLNRAEGEVHVHELTARLLRGAFGEFSTTHAKSSISRCWSTWNQLFAFLVGDGYLPGNPMAAVPKPRNARISPKPLQGEDTPERLLASAALPRPNARHPWPERDLAVLATLLLTGLRSSELLGLKVSCLTGRPGERRVQVVGKGDKARTIPIEDSLHAVIQHYLRSRQARLPAKRVGARSALFVDHRGDPLQRGGLRYLVQASLRAAGVGDRRSPGALVHALRHTFATRLADDGATAKEIMVLLGHASMTTSQAYIDTTASEQRRSAAGNRTYRALDSLADSPQRGD